MEGEAQKLRLLWQTRDHPKQQEFGERFGIGNQSAVTQFLNGKVGLSLKAARGFAEGLGVDIGEFSPRLAAEATRIAAVAPSEAEFVLVRHAAVRFSQGHGRVVFDEGEKAPLSFRREFLRGLGISERSAVVVDSDGNSNSPEIPDRAVLLVHTADVVRTALRPAKFYAFRRDGELFIKKLYPQQDEALLAVSANPDKDAYPDMRIDRSTDDFEVIGRVVWMGVEL